MTTLRTIRKRCSATPPRPVPMLCAGFTLIELVVVIVLIGVIGTILGAFLYLPVQGYADLSRRATLVDSAESSLRRMARDIRLALPNSVRIIDSGTGASFALEVLPTLDGARYTTGTGFPARDFDISGDADFDIDGTFQNISIPRTSSTDRLVINNLGTNDASCLTACNAYTASGAQTVITPLGTTITYTLSGSVHHINIGGGGYQFKSASSRKRLFIIQTPVTYICDTSAQTLKRYSGYVITGDQSTIDTDAELTASGASSALIADHVNRCSATTTTSDVQQRGLVTLDLGLSDQGETVRLIHQVMLDNSR